MTSRYRVTRCPGCGRMNAVNGRTTCKPAISPLRSESRGRAPRAPRRGRGAVRDPGAFRCWVSCRRWAGQGRREVARCGARRAVPVPSGSRSQQAMHRHRRTGMDHTERIRQANDEAQARLRAMLDAKVYGDPQHPLTKAYVSAERLLDALLIDAQWETAKAELDALQSKDMAEFAGDHHVYPFGVGR